MCIRDSCNPCFCNNNNNNMPETERNRMEFVAFFSLRNDCWFAFLLFFSVLFDNKNAGCLASFMTAFMTSLMQSGHSDMQTVHSIMHCYTPCVDIVLQWFVALCLEAYYIFTSFWFVFVLVGYWTRIIWVFLAWLLTMDLTDSWTSLTHHISAMLLVTSLLLVVTCSYVEFVDISTTWKLVQ